MKKVAIGGIAAFAIIVVTDVIIHGVILAKVYEETKEIWRQDMVRLMWVNYVLALIYGLCLSWIFSKGYEKKGTMEGIRFGMVTGILMGSGFGYGTYMSFNIPYSLAIQWFLYTIVQYILVGIAFTYIFKESAASTQN